MRSEGKIILAMELKKVPKEFLDEYKLYQKDKQLKSLSSLLFMSYGQNKAGDKIVDGDKTAEIKSDIKIHMEDYYPNITRLLREQYKKIKNSTDETD